MLNYRRDDIQRALDIIDMPLTLGELPKECQLENLHIQTRALLADWLELETDLTQLREAAAAVVEWWSESPFCGEGRMDQEMTNLRIVAGIKAPPQDGTDGDRADDAHEKEGDR